MSTNDLQNRSSVSYEPNDKPPLPLTIGLGLQLAVIAIAGIVLTPAIIVRAAGGSEEFLLWAAFAAALVSGLSTLVQARPVWRIGAGYLLLMGTSGAFIAVSVAAVAEGGPAMLATLVVVSSLFQFALSARLSLLRRILTPAVVGTVIMLIAVTVMPIAFDMLKTEPPEGTPASGPAVVALVTLVVIVCIALWATGALRLWAPIIGVVAGTLVAALFGMYDTERVAAADWIGIPNYAWPGFDLEFGPVFWKLLPAFVFVTLIAAMETIGDASAIQSVSWRRPRAVDFRAVQGAVTADGVGNLLSGLAGTVPNTTYSSSVSVTELTGVAARGVGIAIGCTLVLAAFLPKVLAVILAIPDAVAAAYITVLVAMLFVIAMKMIVRSGLDYRAGLIVGISFWLGVGFQNGVIFPEYIAEFGGGLLENGMTAGGLTALILTLALELASPRRRRMETDFDLAQLPAIGQFVRDFAARSHFDETMCNRLDAVSEEMLQMLLQKSSDDADSGDQNRRLRVTAHKESGGAILEFVVASVEGNIEDQIALLGERGDRDQIEEELSLRLLRHLASSVRHQQYHDTDILTARVDAADRSLL